MDISLPVLSGEEATTASQPLSSATVLFAGDSGDGMQLTGSQFTLATAHAQNDLATLPDYPAEIRAPAGTTYGVSAFQIRFGAGEVRTPGDAVDALVAMNPAALKVHLGRVRSGGTLVVDQNAFSGRGLGLAGYDENPLESEDALGGYQVIPVELTRLTREALSGHDALGQQQKDRAKNMFALGLSLWLYSRPLAPALEWLGEKFADKPDVRAANLHVLRKGYHYGETTDQFATRYEVRPADLAPGTYRTVRGVDALALGLVTAGEKSGLDVFYASYPITPASDILHAISKHKNFGVKTFQAEDEIAAATSAIGASFGGALGITATSGPGMALKAEALGLAVMTELPLVAINMQRGGPSTGLPTKTEQGDLLQALYGRNGASPAVVLAPSSPADCYDMAYEACRLAVKYMTPVILLADGYLGNGSEPWRLPNLGALPAFDVTRATETNGENAGGEDAFLPYVRSGETGARPWAVPGTPGLEHRLGGLEKEHATGDVSYDPANHQEMTEERANKIARAAQDIPPLIPHGAPAGTVGVVGWGSTEGATVEAVSRVHQRGNDVGNVHLRHLNPLPADLGDVLARFDRILVPELNEGQLLQLLRARFEGPFEGLNKVQGQPFRPSEIEEKIEWML